MSFLRFEWRVDAIITRKYNSERFPQK